MSLKSKMTQTWLFCLVCLACRVDGQLVQIDCSNYTINQQANYFMIINDLSVTIPAGAKVGVYFPEDYSALLLFQKQPYSSFDPTNDNCPVTCTGISLVYNGYGFVFSGMFPSSALLNIIYTVFNIPNPSKSGITGNFGVVIFSGATIHYTASPTGITYVSQTMSCSATIALNLLKETTPLNLTFSPNNAITFAKIFLPSSWQNQLILTTVTTQSIYCKSTVYPSLTCVNNPEAVYVNNFIFNSSISPSIDTVVNQVINPTSIINAGQITIKGYMNSIETDTCSLFIGSSNFANDYLIDPTVSVSYLPSDLISVAITLTMPKENLATDFIYLTFPSQFSLTINPSNYVVLVGGSSVAMSFNINSTSNTISFAPFSASTQTTIQLIASGISRPREALISNTFNVYTLRSNTFVMANSSCCAVSLSARLSLLLNSITLSSYQRLKTNVDYTFSISTNFVPLQTTDYIIIQFPSEYSSQIVPAKNASICSAVTITALGNASNIKASIGCSVNNSKLIVSAFLISNVLASDTYLIKISGILTNPNQSPNDAFTITTISNNNLILESNRNTMLVIVASSLTSFSVSLDSYVSCAANVGYTFSIGNVGALSQNYQLKVQLPAEISEVNYNILVCKLNAIPTKCYRDPITIGTTTHSIYVLVQNALSTITSLLIKGLTNPSNLSPSSTFKASIYNDLGGLVENSATNITVTMTTAGTFRYFQVSANNYSNPSTLNSITSRINSNSNVLCLMLVSPYSPVVNLSSIVLTITNSSFVLVDGSTMCQHSYLSLSCSFSNDVSNNIVVSIQSISLSNLNNNMFSINLTNLVILDFQSIKVNATLSYNGFASLTLTSYATLSQMFSQPVTAYTLLQSSYLLGQPTTITISINMSTFARQNLLYFIAYIPRQFTAPAYTLNISAASFTPTNSFTLAALTNPTTQTYNSFLFQAFDTSNHLVAYGLPTNSSNIYSFQLKCNLPCKSCSPTASSCTSCYSGISWISQSYYRPSNNTCTDYCVEGEYLSSGKCLNCNASCLVCQIYGPGFTDGNPNTCLECSNSNYLLGTICYGNCPSGYFNNWPLCSLCPSNCFKCSSLTICSECISVYMLYQNKCLGQCPSGTVQQTDAITSKPICTNCLSNCLSCNNSLLLQCLICVFPYFLSNGICSVSCPSLPLLYPNRNQQCVACECLTCSQYSYKCTSCALTLSLYNSSCYLACPRGTYSSNNGTNNNCNLCSVNCLKCNGSNSCQLCSFTNALLFVSSNTALCVSSCPNTTIQTIDIISFAFMCESCTNNCLTCNISTSFCLSCKPTFNFHNNSCLISCPINTYSINNNCLLCDTRCLYCQSSNPSNCTQCIADYYLFQDYCYDSCPSGSYLNALGKSCQNCNPLCRTCLNATSCSSCINGFFIFHQFCYSSCPSFTTPKYFTYNGQCIACQPECTTCISSPYECVSCSNTSLYFYNAVTFECSTNCSFPYYSNSTFCITCQTPCKSCDTTYSSCSSCINATFLYHGSCIAACPSRYYELSSNNSCEACASLCLTCSEQRCLTCLSYAYLYKTICVLDCSLYSDLPFNRNSYCTSCLQVPYCEICNLDVTQQYSCFNCVYPYVIFEGNCFNTCPDNYQITDNSTRICSLTQQSLLNNQSLAAYNTPRLPPFAFFLLFIIISSVVSCISKRYYKYTYHTGYLIAFLSIADMLSLLYCIYQVNDKYVGDYSHSNKNLPLILLLISLILKLTFLHPIFLIVVTWKQYMKDARYNQWKNDHHCNWYVLVILTCIFGSRVHKLYYSKMFGLDKFSFRIVSVQKFYSEDIINWLYCFFDLLDISALGIIAYNVFLTYSVLYVTPFEVFAIKITMWVLIVYDLKKPDRGFFKGDEEAAEIQRQLEEIQQERQLHRVDTDDLVRLIRQKSAGEFKRDKMYEDLEIDDFRSVYNPEDYEDVPKVMLRRIQKNIQRGVFRKGKRISIEEKLKRFADTIKPPPVVSQKIDSYLNGLIYWKPPKQLKISKKQETIPLSEESMLQILEAKEKEYQDLEFIELNDKDIKNVTFYESRRKKKQEKYNQRTFLDDLDETIPNDTLDHFYRPSIEKQTELEYNDLMNLNYAKKRHLPRKEKVHNYDDNDLRVLYHEPQKKRKNNLARVGDMIIGKF